MKKLYILILFIISICSCSPDYPTTLYDCYRQLDSIFENTEILKIKNSMNSNYMLEYHFGIGQYIRNNWIRDDNIKLIKEINYKPWKIGADDISGVILRGYWHYIHNEKYDWSEYLNSSEKYYKSHDAPNTFPDKSNLKKENVIYYIEHGDYSEVIHVYKNIDNGKYYIFTHSYGWRILSYDEYSNFENVEDKEKILNIKQ